MKNDETPKTHDDVDDSEAEAEFVKPIKQDPISRIAGALKRQPKEASEAVDALSRIVKMTDGVESMKRVNEVARRGLAAANQHRRA